MPRARSKDGGVALTKFLSGGGFNGLAPHFLIDMCGGEVALMLSVRRWGGAWVGKKCDCAGMACCHG
jgi:hypothetical protein